MCPSSILLICMNICIVYKCERSATLTHNHLPRPSHSTTPNQHQHQLQTMCGRARCVVSHAGAANVLGVPVTAFQDADKYTPRENCAPGSYTPILYMNKDGKRSLRSMKVSCPHHHHCCRCCCLSLSLSRLLLNQSLTCTHSQWGLVPFWTKKDAKPDHWRMFNARSETIGINNVFKRLVDKKRCVVLMNG